MITITELRNIMKEFKPGAHTIIKFTNEGIELVWVVPEERITLSIILEDEDFKNAKELREWISECWEHENARVH